MLKDSSRRGFAGMSAEKQREIASKGGKAAHEKGTAHQFNSEEASAAGKKGGANVFAKLGKPHMSNIGRLGGKARGSKLVAREPEPLHGMDLDDDEVAGVSTSETQPLEPVDLD